MKLTNRKAPPTEEECNAAVAAAAAEREAFARAGEMEQLLERAAGGDLRAAHRLRELHSAAHAQATSDATKVGLTRAEAAQYKRDWEALHRRRWDLMAKFEFLRDHYVIDQDPAPPLPTSTTSQREWWAVRFAAFVKQAVANAANSKTVSAEAAAKAAPKLVPKKAKTEEERRRATFFT